jgi:hypothetical protein
MNKDVKKLIAEAFNELYHEMMSEAPQTLRKTKIDDNEVDSIIQNSMRRGTPVPNLFASEDIKSRENFDAIIDALADDYKTTGNERSKQAIQASFYPTPGSKMQRSVGAKFLGNPELEDAAASAYEQVLIGNFDKIMDLYKSGSRGLGAIFTNDMRNKVYNYIVKGYRGGEGSKFDVVGGEEKALGLDEPLGDSGEGTFGDKLASMAIGPETAMEKGFAKEKDIQKKKDILQDVVKWLDNTFDENGDENGKRRMIAFKGILDGASPEEIFEENPGVFKEPRYVSMDFERLVNSPEAKEISKMISQIYGINFDLSNVDPKKMKQTSAMNPEFGGFSKIVRQATPEMQAAQKELNDVLGVVGLKSTDFNSDKKREAVIANLTSRGMEAELENILSAEEALNNAAEKAKAAGEYDVKVPLLPSSEEEEQASGERMYEGVDFDKLMERVLRRISG